MNIIEISDSEFRKEVLESNVPILVDFWAPWCGPCRIVGEDLKKIAKDYITSIKIVKVNVDNNSEVASKYNINTIPTMILFKKGKIITEIVGAVGYDKIKKILDENLSDINS